MMFDCRKCIHAYELPDGEICKPCIDSCEDINYESWQDKIKNLNTALADEIRRRKVAEEDADRMAEEVKSTQESEGVNWGQDALDQHATALEART